MYVFSIQMYIYPVNDSNLNFILTSALKNEPHYFYLIQFNYDAYMRRVGHSLAPILSQIPNTLYQQISFISVDIIKYWAVTSVLLIKFWSDFSGGQEAIHYTNTVVAYLFRSVLIMQALTCETLFS